MADISSSDVTIHMKDERVMGLAEEVGKDKQVQFFNPEGVDEGHVDLVLFSYFNFSLLFRVGSRC